MAVPFVGPLVALVVWVGVINWRYPGGWIKAAVIGLGAWVSASSFCWSSYCRT